jgi:hypothetical protein
MPIDENIICNTNVVTTPGNGITSSKGVSAVTLSNNKKLSELLPENTPSFPMDNTSSIIEKNQAMRKKILDFMALGQIVSYYDIDSACAEDDIDTFFTVFQQLKRDGIIYEPIAEKYALKN